jgi:hypothetical protein
MYEGWFSTTAEDIRFGAQIGCRHLPVYVGEPNGAASAIDGRLSRFGCRLRGTFLVKCSVIEFGDSGNSSRQGRVIGSMMELYRPSITPIQSSAHLACRPLFVRQLQWICADIDEIARMAALWDALSGLVRSRCTA